MLENRNLNQMLISGRGHLPVPRSPPRYSQPTDGMKEAAGIRVHTCSVPVVVYVVSGWQQGGADNPRALSSRVGAVGLQSLPRCPCSAVTQTVATQQVRGETRGLPSVLSVIPTVWRVPLPVFLSCRERTRTWEGLEGSYTLGLGTELSS